MTKNEKKNDRPWSLIDAAQEPLGRLSVKIANLLSGKNRIDLRPNLDRGDSVVVINAARVVTTGQEAKKKFYYRYSGYPGGLKKESLEHLKLRRPQEIIRHAVSGMLPKNKLLKRRLARLFVYPEASHPHQGQIKNYGS